jgi:hypothetical protein
VTWEEQFDIWAQPPSQSEQEKCEHAESAVKNAIAGAPEFAGRSVRAFAQGSYANRTNVKAESDVDICALCTDSIFFKLPDGMSTGDFGITTPASYPYGQYRPDVRAALVRHFGASAVREGSKAFDVHANTYRVDADVVPCWEYRWYRMDGTYLAGAAFIPTNGNMIVNWPKQHYENGVAKNAATGFRFKPMVRLLKALRDDMVEQGVAAAQGIPSFLIESLVWNVPDDGFRNGSYRADVRWCLWHIFAKTQNIVDYLSWSEVNGIKSLFIGQPWTVTQVGTFVTAAWNYVGFKSAVSVS